MALPGFTAEASVGPTIQSYRAVGYHGGHGAEYLSPQQFDDDVDVENGELTTDEDEGVELIDLDEDMTGEMLADV